MRHVLLPHVRRLRWPVKAAAFVVHFMHHAAAFFAWAWMALHVVIPIGQAGLHLGTVWQHGLNYFSGGDGHWKAYFAAALVPAIPIALRQAVDAWRALKTWHRDNPMAPETVVRSLRWPFHVGAFGLALMHHVAAYFAWVWMILHVVAQIGQAGLHAGTILDNGIAYFSSVGGDAWPFLLAVAFVPAFVLALWRAEQAFVAFRSWVHEHRGEAGGEAPVMQGR